MPTRVNLIFWPHFFLFLLLAHNFIFNHLAKNSKAIWVHINFIHIPFRAIPYRKRKEWREKKTQISFITRNMLWLVFFSSHFLFVFLLLFLLSLTGIERKLHTEKVIKETTTTTTNININATIKWNGQRKICDSMFFALFLSFSLGTKKCARCE